MRADSAASDLDAAVRDAIWNIEGDLYLWALGCLTPDQALAAIRETKNRLKEAIGYDA